MFFPYIIWHCNSLHFMTDSYTLRTKYGFDTVEIESIQMMFNWHFNYDESHHVLLSEYYKCKRPDWVPELLVFIKSEVLKLKLVDRRQFVSVPGIADAQFQEICRPVAIEDYDIHSLALAQHFESIKWVLENDLQFNEKLSESLQYLKTVHPTVYYALKKNVHMPWGKYERPSTIVHTPPSYYNTFQSMFK